MGFASAFRPDLFVGQTVIVTGGGSGIGRCTAHELASLGAQHVCWWAARWTSCRRCSRRSRRTVAAPMSPSATSARRRRCERRWRQVVRSHGRIDALVNNAGGQYITPLEAISAKGWQAVIDTNLTGGFLMARETYLQSMRQHGGAIVNMSADHAGSMPGMGHSGAARAGMESFTETAAVEWAHSGVRVNAVAPGYIASSGMDHYPEEFGPQLREMAATVPLGRFGNEAETSAGIVFLLSPAASFISGTTLRIDGARPQVRMGWDVRLSEAPVPVPDSVKPFDGFHRAVTPRLFAG